MHVRQEVDPMEAMEKIVTKEEESMEAMRVREEVGPMEAMEKIVTKEEESKKHVEKKRV